MEAAFAVEAVAGAVAEVGAEVVEAEEVASGEEGVDGLVLAMSLRDPGLNPQDWRIRKSKNEAENLVFHQALTYFQGLE